MAVNSNIGWTDDTANLWWGCVEVHEGCDNCYARVWSHRYDGGRSLWGNKAPRRAVKGVWKQLKKAQKEAAEKGIVRKVFVGSMMDIFEKPYPLIDTDGNPIMEKGKQLTTGDLRNRFFNEVVPNSPNLMFQLLTKRPSNINKYIPSAWKVNPPRNVIFGTSVVNQETADMLIPQLLEVNGLKFLSCEPQLAPIDFKPDWIDSRKAGTIDWIIVGGESGGNKRPYDADWARSIRDQCKAAGVPFFMKQIDKVQDIPDDLQIEEFPEFKIAA